MAEGRRQKEDSLTALEFTRGGIDVPVAGGLVDLQPGRRHWPFTLEKWYADVLLPDGTVILVYLVQFRALGFSRALVTANCPARVPGHSRRRSRAAGRGGQGVARPRCCPNRRRGPVLRDSGLAGRLKYSARSPPAALGAPFVAQRQRTLEWTVEVPDADVEGEVAWPGGRLPIRGRGYRDHVWLDVLPWRMPLRGLAWGRVAAGAARDDVDRRPAGGGRRSLRRLGRWEDNPGGGAPGHARRVTSPRRVGGGGPARPEPGGATPRLAAPGARPPRGEMACPATIGGHAGVAIHERVRWS